MAKGIIVVDAPHSCNECYLRNRSGYCFVIRAKVLSFGTKRSKPDWCPIKPIPQRKEDRPV